MSAEHAHHGIAFVARRPDGVKRFAFVFELASNIIDPAAGYLAFQQLGRFGSCNRDIRKGRRPGPSLCPYETFSKPANRLAKQCIYILNPADSHAASLYPESNGHIVTPIKLQAASSK